MRKIKVLVPIGCRSDEGLSAPLIRRLRETDWCDCTTIPLSPANYIESFKIIEKHLSLCSYDLMIATGDRIEMEASVKCCFLHNIPIAHFYAGILNTITTYDDILRHQITLMADLAFCEDVDSAMVVANLWDIIGKHDDYSQPYRANIHIVGISHLDDLEVDESLVPEEDYDLILYNPPTRFSELGNKTLIRKELDLIIKMWKINGKAIFLDSNPDPYNHFIMEYIISKNMNYEFKYKVERPKFLGLLKNCSRYITNSSNVNYEARPLGLKDEQIIQIGLRNKNRSTPKKLEVGGSDKIVSILHELYKKGDFN